MKTRFSEAVAHTQQLIALGCDPDEALENTRIAVEMDDLTLDLVAENIAAMEVYDV